MVALIALAFGQTPLLDAQQAELERVRAKVADELQLAAYDLVDQMVWEWTQEPVFEEQTPVVLAGVSVPVGLGSSMSALLENHLSKVVIDNPASNVQLVHCPQCTAVVVHSGPEGTVVGRGIDNPDVLAELGDQTGRHALFVDLEAEGAFLVMRARLTRLTPELPVVWSHTLTTSASSPALLRSGANLKSAEDARKEYLDAISDRPRIRIPVSFAVRTYARERFNEESIAPPPFVWLQTGVELSATSARAWTGQLTVGYSFFPQNYQGILAQARVHRLVTGRVRSRTRPDLYLFLGGAAITVWGPATAAFINEPLTVDQIISGLNGDGPRTSFGTFQVGLDLRFGNRIGVASFLEAIPDLQASSNLGDYVFVAGIGFQSLGTEVTVCF